MDHLVEHASSRSDVTLAQLFDYVNSMLKDSTSGQKLVALSGIEARSPVIGCYIVGRSYDSLERNPFLISILKRTKCSDGPAERMARLIACGALDRLNVGRYTVKEFYKSSIGDDLRVDVLRFARPLWDMGIDEVQFEDGSIVRIPRNEAKCNDIEQLERLSKQPPTLKILEEMYEIIGRLPFYLVHEKLPTILHYVLVNGSKAMEGQPDAVRRSTVERICLFLDATITRRQGIEAFGDFKYELQEFCLSHASIPRAKSLYAMLQGKNRECVT
ncbi:hypothetical protein CANCADRAFT_74143 [Tortispora caseinolytica NRRL Y-17796]|uniref:Uncharacterized protein n=1 Tax=Tortispora caseinolytica NRRL Y-17796 TaxID=767744 RepID=A0A1E4TIR5_9ASCO|nr:hypothetical protein CANCADRAFT_74143 [Tortispora caseinolytica NRRL Y-17796]